MITHWIPATRIFYARFSQLNTRTKIVLILCTLFAIAIILKSVIFTDLDDKGFLINISTEILGAIIIFLIVDRILKNEEKQQREKLFAAALRSLKNPLRRYINMWLHISNSNEDEVAEELSDSISLREYLLTDAFLYKIQNRSFNERYTEATFLSSHDERTLAIQVPKIQKQFMSDIDRIIDNYAHAFDPETIELLQHFAETAHLYGTFYFWQTCEIGENRWFQTQNAENIREHLESLMNLLDKYNSNVIDSEKWTNENIFKLTEISGDVPNVKW